MLFSVRIIILFSGWSVVDLMYYEVCNLCKLELCKDQHLGRIVC